MGSAKQHAHPSRSPEPDLRAPIFLDVARCGGSVWEVAVTSLDHKDGKTGDTVFRIEGTRPKQLRMAAVSSALLTPAPGCSILLSVTEVSTMSKPTDLVQGTLDLLILKVVALEPMHGWAIAQRIHQMSSEVLQVGQSALYPALHKLEQQGWVSAEWKISETNRRAKYYKLTQAGRKALTAEAANWERLSTAISAIVRTA